MKFWDDEKSITLTRCVVVAALIGSIAMTLGGPWVTAWFIAVAGLRPSTGLTATLLVLGGITTASEWRRIHAPGWKKILYTLTFPLFMLTYLPISMAALFMKVEWKPIRHGAAARLPANLMKN